MTAPAFHTGPHPALTYGYAGANSVDFTDSIALEVNGVENGNVRKVRTVKTKLSPADAEAVLAAVSRARMVGTFVAFDEALSGIVETLGLTPTRKVHAA